MNSTRPPISASSPLSQPDRVVTGDKGGNHWVDIHAPADESLAQAEQINYALHAELLGCIDELQLEEGRRREANDFAGAGGVLWALNRLREIEGKSVPKRLAQAARWRELSAAEDALKRREEAIAQREIDLRRKEDAHEADRQALANGRAEHAAAIEKGATWPKHDTRHLTSLRLAAQRHWALYDPTDPSTAPTNATVANWLVETQHISEKIAIAMASILRADDLSTGPRKRAE